MKLITQQLPRTRFNDKKEKTKVLSNRDGSLMVIKEIVFQKVPGVSNTIDVSFVLPDPETIDVVFKEENKKGNNQNELPERSS